jgi:hypothetical protein
MVIYCIQPGGNAWYVLRDGKPTARHSNAQQALGIALLLTHRSRERGEEAVFAGIVTEPLEPEESRRLVLSKAA